MAAIMSANVTELDSSDSTGEGLAERLAARDPRALDEIYARYAGTCFGYLVSTLRDRATAEDVQQQVFLEVWQRAESYDPRRGGLLTWIMTIARSRAIDQQRRRIPTPVEDPQTSEPTASEVDELVDRWHFAALLRQLPGQEALLLRMRFHDGLSQSEIADRTGIPLGTVKMRMVSGLRRLRAFLEEE
jgi:RNA polymerase sigma-70 factor (ECF subfamily)